MQWPQNHQKLGFVLCAQTIHPQPVLLLQMQCNQFHAPSHSLLPCFHVPSSDARRQTLKFVDSHAGALIQLHTSLTPGTTLQHHPHQLLALPSCSLTKNFPISFSSPHSGTQAPTFTIRTNFFLTTPPIPSISCLAYPGPICPLLSLPGVPTCVELLPGLEGGLAVRLLLSISRASSASQSISCSTSRAATHSPPRPQGTPRFPSPMPTPRPPREGR